jgi:hypothetical protein
MCFNFYETILKVNIEKLFQYGQISYALGEFESWIVRGGIHEVGECKER